MTPMRRALRHRWAPWKQQVVNRRWTGCDTTPTSQSVGALLRHEFDFGSLTVAPQAVAVGALRLVRAQLWLPSPAAEGRS